MRDALCAVSQWLRFIFSFYFTCLLKISTEVHLEASLVKENNMWAVRTRLTS